MNLHIFEEGQNRAELERLGAIYPFAITFPDGKVCLAGSLTELVGCVPNMPDNYVDLGPDDAFVARMEMAHNVAQSMQEIHAAELQLRGAWDPDEEPEDVVQAILGGRDMPVIVDFWGHIVPLILPADLYVPISDVPRPTGNVTFVDLLDERRFLESLDNLGLLAFRVNPDLLR